MGWAAGFVSGWIPLVNNGPLKGAESKYEAKRLNSPTPTRPAITDRPSSGDGDLFAHPGVLVTRHRRSLPCPSWRRGEEDGRMRTHCHGFPQTHATAVPQRRGDGRERAIDHDRDVLGRWDSGCLDWRDLGRTAGRNREIAAGHRGRVVAGGRESRSGPMDQRGSRAGRLRHLAGRRRRLAALVVHSGHETSGLHTRILRLGRPTPEPKNDAHRPACNPDRHMSQLDRIAGREMGNPGRKAFGHW